MTEIILGTVCIILCLRLFILLRSKERVMRQFSDWEKSLRTRDLYATRVLTAIRKSLYRSLESRRAFATPTYLDGEDVEVLDAVEFFHEGKKHCGTVNFNIDDINGQPVFDTEHPLVVVTDDDNTVQVFGMNEVTNLKLIRHNIKND